MILILSFNWLLKILPEIQPMYWTISSSIFTDWLIIDYVEHLLQHRNNSTQQNLHLLEFKIILSLQLVHTELNIMD